RRPGLDIFRTFNEVGLAVKRVTGNAQQPWVSSSPIDGNFYFSGGPVGTGASTVAVPAGPCAAAAAPWRRAEAIGSRGGMEAHLARFGNCPLGGLAAVKIDQLKKADGQKRLEAGTKVAVAPPPAVTGADSQNTLLIDTTQGRVVIRLRPDLAPNHVER